MVKQNEHKRKRSAAYRAKHGLNRPPASSDSRHHDLPSNVDRYRESDTDDISANACDTVLDQHARTQAPDIDTFDKLLQRASSTVAGFYEADLSQEIFGLTHQPTAPGLLLSQSQAEGGSSEAVCNLSRQPEHETSSSMSLQGDASVTNALADPVCLDCVKGTVTSSTRPAGTAHLSAAIKLDVAGLERKLTSLPPHIQAGLAPELISPHERAVWETCRAGPANPSDERQGLSQTTSNAADSARVDTTVSTHGLNQAAPKHESQKTSEDAELEDWLDSVLDD